MTFSWLDILANIGRPREYQGDLGKKRFEYLDDWGIRDF